MTRKAESVSSLPADCVVWFGFVLIYFISFHFILLAVWVMEAHQKPEEREE